MSEFPKWPLVCVEWIDSTGSSSWQVLDKIPNIASTCRSVGWLAAKNKISLVLYSDLATHPANDHPHGHSEQVIPIGCITKITKIPFVAGRAKRTPRK